MSSGPASQGTAAPLALPAAAAAGGARAFTFGGARERDPVCRAVVAVAEAVAAADGVQARAPHTKFLFRPARSPFARAPPAEAAKPKRPPKEGPKEGPSDAPDAKRQRAELEAANASAAAAAALPLPALPDDEDEQGFGATRVQGPAPPAADNGPPALAAGAAAVAPSGAASGGGWGAAFLQQNAATSAAAARVVEEEVERKRKAAAPAPQPTSGGGGASADTGACAGHVHSCIVLSCLLENASIMHVHVSTCAV